MGTVWWSFMQYTARIWFVWSDNMCLTELVDSSIQIYENPLDMLSLLRPNKSEHQWCCTLIAIGMPFP